MRLPHRRILAIVSGHCRVRRGEEGELHLMRLLSFEPAVLHQHEEEETQTINNFFLVKFKA